MGILVSGIFYPALFTGLSIFFHLIFNIYITWIYLGLVIATNIIGGWIYGIGYMYMKRNHLKGTLISLLGGFLLLLGVILLICYTLLIIFFSTLWTTELKIILLITFIFAATPFLILSLEKCFDIATFFRDVWRQRADFYKLTYTIEEKGKLTYIHLQKNDSNISNMFGAAAMLKIQEVMYTLRLNPEVPISFYFKSAFLLLVTELVRNFTAWPRTRNRLYRSIAKVKLGKDVCLGQWTRVDPLFPDLIEFEDGSGVGIGCQLLTHNFIQKDPLTISMGPIKIEKNARIGAFCTILPGVTIGEGAIVGAGAVVTDDIPPHSIAFGVPAKVVDTIK